MAPNVPKNRLSTEPKPVDVAFRRLKAASGTVGETAQGSHWIVTGNNGESVIQASAATQAAAWQMALAQAEAVGMLGNDPKSTACSYFT